MFHQDTEPLPADSAPSGKVSTDYVHRRRKEMNELDGRKKPDTVLSVNIVLCSCLLLYCKEDLIYMLSLTFLK